MKISGIAGFYTDWVKGVYHFGKSLTNMLAERAEASPMTRRFGGGALDAFAGSVFTYSAASSVLGSTLAIAGAVTAVSAAPVAALGTVAASALWIALAGISGAFGLGFLRAGMDKFGIPTPAVATARVRAFVDKKISPLFNKKSGKNITPKAAPKKPSPKSKFDL